MGLIQRLLHNISIKRVLYLGLVCTGVFLLSLNIVIITVLYRGSKEADRMLMANELADNIIVASGWEAIERGATTTALSSPVPADVTIIQRIKDFREKGDEAFNKAHTLMKSLIAFDPSHIQLKESIKKVESLKQELENARLIVDGNLMKNVKEYAPKDWFKTMTAFIDANADLRLKSITSPQAVQTFRDGVRLSVELRQAIWLLSEYAGRERATIGSHISAGMPVTDATAADLRTFRAIVDLNLKAVLSFKDDPVIDANLKAQIVKMEKVFLGSFEKTRKDIYDAAYLGNYPISAKEWMERATGAINSVLDVSSAANQSVAKQLRDVKAHVRKQIISYIASVIILFLMGIIPFIIVKYKIVHPMSELMNSILAIEESGDLTREINLASNDEIGQIADAFNKMIGKFHGIVKGIHSGTEHLTNSSQTLSESAQQIASGADEQSARASQVATASTEMSATIVEIAKNASGAVEAARNASKAAANGGGIVNKSIDSMNSIAGTTKQTSKVIATLGNRSNEIGKIIKVIDDIADQTNLLALNAAIEAARAGEQGRGFAVVADEVRKLAERTTKATKEIGDMIGAIQDDTGRALSVMDSEVKAVEDGVKLVQEAGGALKEIIHQVENVTGMIQQIATASEEQSTAADQISGDIETVAGITKETSGNAQQILKASQQITALANNLKSKVQMFHVVSKDADVIEMGHTGLPLNKPPKELTGIN